jgi:hypothetical protein
MVANIVRPDAVVPIGLWEERQFGDIQRLRVVDEAALLYFRESSRASTAKTKLAMLAITAEALAGDSVNVTQCGQCDQPFSCVCPQKYQTRGTDKQQLEKILGVQLYKRLYKGKSPVRHKLMHGSMISEAEASELGAEAYSCVRKYLQEHFDLQSDLEIRNAPRPLDGVIRDTGCVKLPPEWLSTPFNPLHVNWQEKLQQLESKELWDFGEMVDPPADL